MKKLKFEKGYFRGF